jgi:hypothetical protein
MLACASPGYLARHGMPAHPKELIGHRVVAYSHFSGLVEWKFEGPDGEVAVRTQARVYPNTDDTRLPVIPRHIHFAADHRGQSRETAPVVFFICPLKVMCMVSMPLTMVPAYRNS